MKRFHVNVSVADLQQSVRFYNALFGEQPTVAKPDYAKWMLEDPRVNFSITQSAKLRGVNHVGLQVESETELQEVQARLDAAEEQTFKQPDANCCYANSSKTWARDPDDVAWETFVTHGTITHYGNDHVPGLDAATGDKTTEGRCCA